MTTLQQSADSSTHAEFDDRMKWLPPDAIEAAEHARMSLLEGIFNHSGAHWAYSRTKLYTHAISPGCSLCGQGAWSCLFINGICNARCFYCPTAQDDPGQPMANTIVFENPDDYADYVSRFDIKGVGFSGGEPLMTFERLLAFLQTLKARSAAPVYTWMYTNGLLVNRARLEALGKAGLDEMRFDLSANHYRLDALTQAIGVIPRVTVEIPAIPEDIGTVKQLMPVLAKKGVKFLNLHQMRCTPFNVRNLVERGYTFVRGPQTTVLESELTALALVRHALEQEIDLPINYCAFAFRHQHQGMGARKRNAGEVKAGYEDITPTGHIRYLKITGPASLIEKTCRRLASSRIESSRYLVSGTKDSLSFSAELWPLIDFSNVRLHIGYRLAVLRSAVSYHHPFKKIVLDSGKTLIVEKQANPSGFWLEGNAIEIFGQMIQDPNRNALPKLAEALPPAQYAEMVAHETIFPGLAKYC